MSEGKVTQDTIVFPSSSWRLLEWCLFKELTLLQPYANQVFEHAGMWWPIVRPIMWAHKGGLCNWKLRCVKIERGQAYAISRAQWMFQWGCMYCMSSVMEDLCALCVPCRYPYIGANVCITERHLSCWTWLLHFTLKHSNIIQLKTNLKCSHAFAYALVVWTYLNTPILNRSIPLKHPKRKKPLQMLP